MGSKQSLFRLSRHKDKIVDSESVSITFDVLPIPEYVQTPVQKQTPNSWKKWKGRSSSPPTDGDELQLTFIDLGGSGVEEINWNPYRSEDGVIREWKAIWGAASFVRDAEGNHPLKIEWVDTTDFFIIAKTNTNEWWTLLSPTLNKNDTETAKQNSKNQSTKPYKNSTQFTLEGSQGIRPKWPDKNLKWRKSPSSNGWELEHVELTKVNNVWVRTDFPASTTDDKIQLVDKHGRLVWILQSGTPGE